MLKYFYLSAILSFLTSYFFSDQILLQIIIIFGQAHFLIAYFYRHKAGKMDKSYIKSFTIYFIIFAAISTYVAYNIAYFNYLVFFTVMVFVAHYFFDEMKILNFQSDRLKTLGCITVLLAFLCAFLNKTFMFSISAVWPFILFTLFALAYLLVELVKGNYFPADAKSITGYLFILGNVLFPIILIFTPATMLQISSFIIVFHYIRWYLFYYEKMMNKPEALKSYIDAVFWVHVFVFSLFTIYSISMPKAELTLFFNPIFFYGWTNLHIFLSIRLEDYKFIKKYAS